MDRPRSLNEHRAVPCPGPGGEPLCSAAVLSDCSKRLPGITQRVLLAGGLCCEGIDQRRPIELPNYGSFPGAACLPRRLSVAAKSQSCPFQSGSPPGAGSLLRAASLQTFCVHCSPFKRLPASGLLVVVLVPTGTPKSVHPWTTRDEPGSANSFKFLLL